MNGKVARLGQWLHFVRSAGAGLKQQQLAIKQLEAARAHEHTSMSHRPALKVMSGMGMIADNFCGSDSGREIIGCVDERWWMMLHAVLLTGIVLATTDSREAAR